jgi:integrase
LRRSELTGLRWGDVEGDILHVRRTKILKSAHAERTIPLSKTLKEILLSIRPTRPDATEPIFARPPATEANISLQFLRSCRKAGIEQFSFHHLHQTTIEWMSRAGPDLKVMSLHLGHSDVRSTARYIKSSGAGLSKAIALVERTLKSKSKSVER